MSLQVGTPVEVGGSSVETTATTHKHCPLPEWVMVIASSNLCLVEYWFGEDSRCTLGERGGGLVALIFRMTIRLALRAVHRTV